jgi:hypothetical protein
MAGRFEDKKINEALELLNELANDEKVNLQDMVSDKYSNLKSVLVSVGERNRHQARKTHAQRRERAEDLASKVDRRVHRSWGPYLGRAVLGLLTLGYVYALGYSVGRSRT